MARKRRHETGSPAPETAPANTNEQRVFTITELAARWRVDRHTVTASINSGRLQAFKVGERVYRIREAEVVRYEQQNMMGGAA